MRVIILGADGYIGFPLSLRLARRGHFLLLVDNFTTRRIVRSLDSRSVVPVHGMPARLVTMREYFPSPIKFIVGDVTRLPLVERWVKEFQPECIVHLAQQPRAPYSMIGPEEAWTTIANNVRGNLNVVYAIKRHAPHCHLLKMGSAGEYGTPNFAIEEGFMAIKYKGRSDTIPVPRAGQSFYHLSKIFDSYVVTLANKIWNVTATDVMQGIVYGLYTQEQKIAPELSTRMDVDAIWGTVLHRQCAELVALGHILIYGSGKMTRGFLSLEDSITCLELLMTNPPPERQYRVVNQLDEVLSTLDIADRVEEAGSNLGLQVQQREYIPDPRVEAQRHYYNPATATLKALGFTPAKTMKDELGYLLQALMHYRHRIPVELLRPTVRWRRTRNLTLGGKHYGTAREPDTARSQS